AVLVKAKSAPGFLSGKSGAPFFGERVKIGSTILYSFTFFRFTLSFVLILFRIGVYSESRGRANLQVHRPRYFLFGSVDI
ncbi:MAG: hypothetical protein ACI3U0_08805, partial [Oscillospiraceae bacterium]